MSFESVQHVETRFGRLAYRSDGPRSGVPLVLLQRYRGSIEEWDPLLISRMTAHREVIRFDSAGVGRSSGDCPGSVADMAEIAVAFMEGLGLPQADLLGWSLGGYVAQAVTLDHPRYVRRLIIAGSGPGGITEAIQHPHVRDVVVKDVIQEEDFMFLFFTDTDAGRTAGQAYLERLRGVVVKPTTMATALKQRTAIIAWTQGEGSARSRLGRLNLPVLVANGVHDVMVPAYGAFVISQDAPNAKLVLYPDAGHGFLFQYIDAFSEEVDRFLA